VRLKESLDGRGAPVEYRIDVAVPCGPDIGEIKVSLLYEEVTELVLQALYGRAEVSAPPLAPARLAPGAAPTVFLPPP